MNSLKHFSDQEFVEAGSNINLMDANQLLVQDRFADNMKKEFGKVYIMMLFNGLTSGSHASEEHDDGKATDFWILNKSGKPIPVKRVIQIMMYSGFRGVGSYWNGKAWSFHGDTGDNYREWHWDRSGDKVIRMSNFNMNEEI